MKPKPHCNFCEKENTNDDTAGQQFYDRFAEILKKEWRSIEQENGMFFALDIAARAAGIKK